jgi:nucleotide-binding universal stress UspA family protein
MEGPDDAFNLRQNHLREGKLEMLPIKNIVCPTDFSEPSFEALKAADELAAYFKATLHVVNVVPLVPIVEAPIGVESASFNVASYQQELEMQANVVTEVLIGNASGEVLRYASEKAADMIVIATHGLSGWRRFISGSTTEQIVRQASCPVLTIRKPRVK